VYQFSGAGFRRRFLARVPWALEKTAKLLLRPNPDSLRAEADFSFRNQSTSTNMSPPSGPLRRTLPVFLLERELSTDDRRGPARLVLSSSITATALEPTVCICISSHLSYPLLSSSPCTLPTGHQRSISEKDRFQM